MVTVETVARANQESHNLFCVLHIVVVWISRGLHILLKFQPCIVTDKKVVTVKMTNEFIH